MVVYLEHYGSLTHMMHALWTQVSSSVVSYFLSVLHMTMNLIKSCIMCPISKWCVTLPQISVVIIIHIISDEWTLFGL